MGLFEYQIISMLTLTEPNGYIYFHVVVAKPLITIYFVLKKLLSKLLFYSYWKILDSTGIVDNISFCQLSGRSENSAGII
jgi:hypothetical protein